MLHGGMHALKDAVQFRYLLKIVLMSLFLAKGPGHARLYFRRLSLTYQWCMA